MTTGKIFISYHKKSELFKCDVLEPIHVGRELAHNNKDISWLEDNTTGDNTGDNISCKNPNYCELTAQYWVWKNCKYDYVGFCHYRRLFDFNNSYSNEEYAKNICGNSWSSDDINRLMNDYDIIIPPVYNVHPVSLPQNIMTNYDFYKRNHNIEDLNKVIAILKEDYPDYLDAATTYLNSTKSVFFNMFVMKWEIFDDYCKWLFDILDKLEKIMIDNNSYQKRGFGFLAKRLLNIYILNLATKNPDIKIYYLEVINIMPEPIQFEKSKIVLGSCEYFNKSFTKKSNENIDIIFSTDDSYVSHCAAAIVSILVNCVSDVNFRFHILDGGISENNKEKLKSLSKIRNFSINFYDMKKYDFSEFALNRHYISEATYYRLMMLDVLPKDLGKVIYLDCDIIVEQDIKGLWDYDINDYFAGVVEDEGSTLQIRRMGLPLKNNYFNAGVLLLNLKELRKINFKERCFEYYKNNQSIITLQDQDILNGVLNGRCKFLPLNWNTNARIYLGNNLERSYSIQDEIEAGYHPAILHFTDSQKPWKIRCTHILQDEYWKYLKMTPYKMNYAKFCIKKLMSFIYSRKKQNNTKTTYLFGIPIYKKQAGHIKSLEILGIRIFKKVKTTNNQSNNFDKFKLYKNENDYKEDLIVMK